MKITVKLNINLKLIFFKKNLLHQNVINTYAKYFYDILNIRYFIKMFGRFKS